MEAEMEKIISDIRNKLSQEMEYILEINQSDSLLQVYIEIFIMYYGKESLRAVFTDFNHYLKENTIADLELEDKLDPLIFSQSYEDFLLDEQKASTGSFYTPKYIISYMIEKSIVKYLAQKTGLEEEKLFDCFRSNFAFNLVEYEMMLVSLNTIKIIDIACGTGLFLIGCLNKILYLKKNLYRCLGLQINEFEQKKYIVDNNLCGIDIQEQPIKIAKLILAAMIYDSDNPCYKETIKFNLIVGDSLIDEKVYVDTAIGKVLSERGGFDIVIGNPPYIGEKGNKEVFSKIKNSSFGQKYYEGKMDYFYFFIYKGIELLNKEGFLSYITTNYFVTADGAKRLRNHIRENHTFLEILNFNDYGIFKSAKGQHNLIFFLRKEFDKKQSIKISYIKDSKISDSEVRKMLENNQLENEKIGNCLIVDQDSLYDKLTGNILIQDNEFDGIFKKIIQKKNANLGDLCEINQGIVSGADKVTGEMMEKKLSKEAIEKYNITIGQGIFVLSTEEAIALDIINHDLLKPMFKNSDIQKYRADEITDKYFLYITDNMEESDEAYRIIMHLKRFMDVLKLRREIANGSRQWYSLQWPRRMQIFERTKIVVPHRSKLNKFALVECPWYASADVYYISKVYEPLDWYFLLGQLNSKIMYFWLYNRGKRKGDYLELYANPLKQLPILLSIDDLSESKLINIVKEVMEKEKQGHDSLSGQKIIDQILYDAYGFTQDEINIIEKLYDRGLREKLRKV